MDSLQKQNQLLKGYVTSLQKQNQARNVERNTLFHEIDRMTEEINRLNALLSKQNSRVVISNPSDKEIKTLKQTIASLTKEIQGLKITNSQLTSDLRAKTNELTISNQEQQRLTLEIKGLKQLQSQSTTTNNRILLLESEINSNKIKLNQITVLEQNLKVSNTKITELQTTNRKLQNDCKRIQTELRRQQSEVKRLENENKELKLNNRSSMEISGLLSSKLSLEATIRQLNGKIQWLQGNNKNSQQQKVIFQKRIKDLEKDVLQAKAKLTQYRFNEESLKSFEANLSIKDKEMEALQQMIGSLKENKKYLEKMLRQKEDTIANIETQLSQNKINQSDHHQRQINELIEKKGQLEKELNFHIKNNQDLENELRLLRGQRQLMQRDISMLGKSFEEAQKQISILRAKSSEYTVTQHEPYFKALPQRDRNFKEDDLRLVVSDLKDQIQQLKASQQFKSQINMSNPHHCQSCHHLHLKNHLQRQTRSPQKGAHSKLVISNERDKSPFNKQKWDNLQRKINALRNENETLKKSLFD